jgi:predicted SAM-dependent methyltransferase
MDKRFDLKVLAKDWNKMFVDVLEEKKVHPVTAYQPTRKYQKRNGKLLKLNIAAGPNVFPADWINLDHADFSSYFEFIQTVNTSSGMPDHQKKLWQYCRDGGRIEFQKQNITEPFTQFSNNTVDLIYVGQAIEHINPIVQAPAFVRECHRMLKPGGVIRLTTPDLEQLLIAYFQKDMARFEIDQPAFYKDLEPSMQLSLLMFGSGGEGCVQTNYEGHMCCYTEASLTRLLQEAGFSKVGFFKPGESNSSVMAAECRDEGISHSIICEAVK